MAARKKHPDYDYIIARQERYVETYRRGEAEEMMEWMDSHEFEHADILSEKHGVKHEEARKGFQDTFDKFHDLQLKTVSLHGHKNFTAWEWVVTTKPKFDDNGEKAV